MQRVFWISAVLALSACGGGGSAPSVAGDAPVLYVPGTTTLVSNPLTFAEGQSVQFEPQEPGYAGSFTVQQSSGTAGAACITTSPGTVADGGAFTASTTSSAGCTSYPQSETYNVSDSNGHGASITIEITAP